MTSATRRPTRRPARKKRTHQLPVVIEQDEDGVYIVSVPTLVGCRSYGMTLEEAMKNIAKAAALCLDEAPAPPTGNRFVGFRSVEVDAEAVGLR